MGKVVSCIIARTISTRLPLKVLRSLGQEVTMLDHLIKRLKTVESIDEIYICTSSEMVDDILEDIAKRNEVKIYRGSADNVLERMLSVGKITQAELLLRITGDNPFTSIEYVNNQIELLRKHELDYVRLIDVPIGATAEVMTHDALIRCNQLMDPSVSEYLMLYLFEPQRFKCGVIKPFVGDYSNMSTTVDFPQDLLRSQLLLQQYQGCSLDIKLKNIIDIYLKYDLPDSVIKQSGKIKLPFGKEISFEEFALDMKRRMEGSYLFKLYE